MKTAIINDLHLGVKRTGGTTPASATALNEWAFEQYRKLLQQAVKHGAERIIVNGDLTDRYDIDLVDALKLFEITGTFMSDHTNVQVIWALGNHDLSKDSSKLGTVQFIGSLLSGIHSRFSLVSRSEYWSQPDTLIIPHLVNQDEFDTAVEAATEYGPRYLLLHCNYDNPFAGAADHSLNLSREQARRLKKAGVTIILGHEHQGRKDLGDTLVVVGNQFPTSVADCLSHGDAQKDGKKYMLMIDDEGRVEHIETWRAAGSYMEVDWRDLQSASGEEWDHLQFIRVSGECPREEAPAVVKAIADLRKQHGAFVITNAVKVEGIEDAEDLAMSVEDIGAVDVVQLLYAMLNPEQVEVLVALREKRNA